MPLQKYIEYWVEEVDEYGDIVDFLYQDNSLPEALKIARAYTHETSHVEVERVETWGNDAEGVVRRRYQDVDITTGKLTGDVLEG